MNLVVAQDEVTKDAVCLLASGHPVKVIRADLDGLGAVPLGGRSPPKQQAKQNQERESCPHDASHSKMTDSVSRSILRWPKTGVECRYPCGPTTPKSTRRTQLSTSGSIRRS